MKKATRLWMCLALMTCAQVASAASQDECAIWLCLPGGFPQGCGAAYSAMIDRIEDRKPPLPDFGACAVNPPPGSGSHMTFSWGMAAYVPARQVCPNFEGAWWLGQQACRVEPEQYIKNTSCQVWEGGSYPEGCTQTVRWAEVYTDGQLAGPTYYWSLWPRRILGLQ